jgi:exopolysaccharide production protein ExoZ
VSAEAPSSGRISGLDGLRAYAVLLTFFVHFSAPFAARYAHLAGGAWQYESVADSWSRFLAWLSLSFYGVHLFFIISGYIITKRILAARGDFHYSTFLGGRVWRIYPAFLFALAFSLAAIRIQDPAFVFEWRRVLVNLFFLNGAGPLITQGYNAVTWSLFWEWCFYLLIPIPVMLGWRMKSGPLVPVVAGFALALVAVLLLEGRYWHYVYFFLAGTLGALCQPGIARFLARVPDVAVLAAFLAVTSSLGTLVPMPVLDPSSQRWVASWRFDLFDLAFGIVGLALLFKCSFGGGFLHRLASTKLAAFVGRISYSLFLVHAVVIGLYYNTALASLVPVPGTGTRRFAVDFLLCFGASVAIAWASYHWLERPYLEAKRRRAPLPPGPNLGQNAG